MQCEVHLCPPGVFISRRAKEVAHSIRYLLYNNEELNSAPKHPLKKPYVVAHAYNLVVGRGAETGGCQECPGQAAWVK